MLVTQKLFSSPLSNDISIFHHQVAEVFCHQVVLHLFSNLMVPLCNEELEKEEEKQSN